MARNWPNGWKASTKKSSRRDYTFLPMSLNETPMVERYWQEVGGELFLEFPLTQGSPSSGIRRVDGLIIPDLPERRWEWREAVANGVDATIVEGRHVIAVQAKYRPKRLCMPLLGQTLFAAELLKDLGAASVRGVALCRQDDSALRRVFERYPGMEVAIDDR
jgi:hypothetical protein